MAAKPAVRQWKRADVVIGKFPQVKCAKLPFTENTSETDTGFDLPSKCIVLDCMVEVDTEASGASIDVGLLSSGTNGDADGFLNGISCASAGFPTPAGSNATTYGAFLLGADQTGSNVKTPHGLDADDEKSVTYTTSSHTIAGSIYIFYVDLSEALSF